MTGLSKKAKEDAVCRYYHSNPSKTQGRSYEFLIGIFHLLDHAGSAQVHCWNEVLSVSTTKKWFTISFFSLLPLALCGTEPISTSSSTSALDIFHVVSSLILVFMEKNWLCTSNSRSKWVTEIHYIEKQRFINCSVALVIGPLQRNKQGEKCMGKPGWFKKVKLPAQQGLWSIVVS